MYTLKLTSKNQYIYLSIIVIIGTLLRIFRLDFQSLWYDELHSIIPTHPDKSIASIIEYCKSDQPPAFFLLLHAWFKLLPYNAYVGRLFSVFIGIVGIIAIYFLGREVRSKEVGLFASGITAINWFHIYFSQELRFYTLLFLLSILSYLYFIKSYKTGSRVNFALYTLFSTLLLYTHYYGMVVLATQLVTFIGLIVFFKIRNPIHIVYAIVSGILIVLAFIPWLPTVMADNATNSFWIEKPIILFPALYMYVYLGKDYYLILVCFILTIIALKYGFNLYSRRIDKNSSELITKIDFFILFSWVFFTYLIPFLYSVIAIPMLQERYTIITLPAFFIIFSIGWYQVKNQRVRAIVAISLFFSTLINFVFFNKHYNTIYKTQFRELVQEVIKHNQDAANIYSDGAWYFNYYFEAYHTPYKVIDAVHTNVENNLKGEKAVWVLISPTLQGVSSNNFKYLNTYFSVKKKIVLNDISAIRYERKIDK